MLPAPPDALGRMDHPGHSRAPVERLEVQLLVVGCGPAGADLAGRLAAAGMEVLLIDRLADLSEAAFSSAALPLTAMARHGLPDSLVAHRWRGWRLQGPGEQRREWVADRPLGVVLDFAALRQYLVSKAQRHGSQLRLGLKALDCSRQADGWMLTRLRNRQGELLHCRSRWVVDASGQARCLIGEPQQGLVTGVGVEWLLRVELPIWQQWADRLSFCLGTDWVPQGYGWVFPMQPGVLKLGVCRLEDPPGRQPPLGSLLQQLIHRLLPGGEDQPHDVLDRHGGLIRSTIRRREPHRRGRLIALGDAFSTANLLGGEGIRHALSSSELLAPRLIEAMARDREGPLRGYPAQLRRRLGPRWSLSGRLGRRIWLGLRDPSSDQRLERLLQGLEGCDAEDLSGLLFEYRFERYGLRALPYLLGWR